MTQSDFLPPRTALYLPASNARAIEKARGLAADMIILDLEDAVPVEKKDAARAAAVAAIGEGFGGRIAAIRINGPDAAWHEADLAAVAGSAAAVAVLPKVESAAVAAAVAARLGKPLLAMIETPAGLLNAPAIAAALGVSGLIAGTNDIAHDLRLPPGTGRGGLTLALQTIVLAARAAGVLALDGVWNRLDDADGLEAECREGRCFGFDGKTLIHPNQIEIANRAFGPSEAELEDARALIAAFKGGAERFRDRMIEAMHVASAERLIARG
ncbi:HpcH/HpaI aldolase/citrate lyase family protein [Sphingobium boeckii]|uniref:Citrate lyase subunit beta/citryl-CoA lyase n=1 Tax=Sphingobium boeckii TaxID=1082345 RepID=A0A7W9AKJ3_9SPHN|nr:CoA ester lyase [Sphingobium boeckii]MBB5687370.1 citrate lyase subunit beta/citryl-CoA lyase [Sphingobium boeckii]